MQAMTAAAGVVLQLLRHTWPPARKRGCYEACLHGPKHSSCRERESANAASQKERRLRSSPAWTQGVRTAQCREKAGARKNRPKIQKIMGRSFQRAPPPGSSPSKAAGAAAGKRKATDGASPKVTKDALVQAVGVPSVAGSVVAAGANTGGACPAALSLACATAADSLTRAAWQVSWA
jgi:hypothetical protein